MKYNQKVTINTWFYEWSEWLIAGRITHTRTNGNMIIEETSYQVILTNGHTCRDMFTEEQLTVIT